jgi:hypothetical protein
MKPIAELTDAELARLVRQAAALPDAPPALIRQAIDLWTTPAPPQTLRAAAQGLMRQLTAVLSFDSWAAAPLAQGLRSSRGDLRHLLFSTQGRDIDLRVVPDAQRFVLAGQILGPDETGMVELSPSDDGPAGPPHVVALNMMGEFRIDGIEAGRYVLTLRLGEDTIVIPPIDVGDAPH